MNVFVAGSINNRNVIKEVMKSLECHGYTITYDWTNQVDERKKQEYAINDLEGVKKCDIFVACVEKCNNACRGTLIEIGIALALDKKVVVLGDVNSVYMSHPNVTIFPNMNTFYFMNNCDEILKTYSNK